MLDVPLISGVNTFTVRGKNTAGGTVALGTVTITKSP